MSSSSRISPPSRHYDENGVHSFKRRRCLHGNIDISSSSSSSCFSPCNSAPSSSSFSSCCVSDNHNRPSNSTQPSCTKYGTNGAKLASSLIEFPHLQKEASMKSRISIESSGNEVESSIGSSSGSYSVLHRHHHHHRRHVHHDNYTDKTDDDEVQSRFQGVSIEPFAARHYPQMCSEKGHGCCRIMKEVEGEDNPCNALPLKDHRGQQYQGNKQAKNPEENHDINNYVGGLGFDPNTVFGTTFFSNSGDEDGHDLLFSCASPDNTSWFLNELDSEGNAFLDEVLDHEWMASAIANLEKLNDTMDSCDSCVLHQLQEPWKHT